MPKFDINEISLRKTTRLTIGACHAILHQRWSDCYKLHEITKEKTWLKLNP